jgi:hypothetical protein
MLQIFLTISLFCNKRNPEVRIPSIVDNCCYVYIKIDRDYLV